MRATPVFLALAGVQWEADVVSRLDTPVSGSTGLRVVRRCLDLADLLGAAASGMASAAIVSADLRRLDRDALSRLSAAGVAVVGLTGPDDAEGQRRLAALGIGQILSADASGEAFAEAVVTALRSAEPADASYSSGAPVPSPMAHTPPTEPAAVTEPARLESQGRLIAVWGPAGAPGRTTVAAAVAAELASKQIRTLLADADVYGGTLAQLVGLLDELPGLPAAVRLAMSGALDAAALDRLAPSIGSDLHLLPGISRAERWPELRPAALEQVWHTARSRFPVTVVDTGFNLEQDEELSFDVPVPRRNGATLLTLEQADLVLAVGSADPVGIHRLVRGLATLREAAPATRVRVVLNRVRRGPVGRSPERQLGEALKTYADVSDLQFLPYDLAAADAALLHGRTVVEAAPRSSLRLAVSRLVEELGLLPASTKPVRTFRRRTAA